MRFAAIILALLPAAVLASPTPNHVPGHCGTRGDRCTVRSDCCDYWYPPGAPNGFGVRQYCTAGVCSLYQ
ncbi:hypothetical protein HK097_011148 [Rhizophlyctis rosea]|uniref:Uncharacterized protein n=1 Tax=Rhizophlyctis rosea TaxID=64517 RepID=A0AAD5S843_9FUNG|nr:hypothetical protein HK097_011148 [Rhizophlyctis rosea]